jgi:glycosyltransferase involved in cell wall biosynthesis
MKKILFIKPNFYPVKVGGGSQISIQNLCDLLRENYEIHVLTHKGINIDYIWNPFVETLPDYEEINGIKVYRLSCNHTKNIVILMFKILFKILNFKFYSKIFTKNFIEYIDLYKGPQFFGLEEFLKNNSFDFIYTGTAPYEFPIFISKLNKKLNLKSKLIFKPAFHELVPIYYSDHFIDLYENSDIIHTLTNSEKELIKKQFKINDARFVTIPSFLDLNNYKNLDNIYLISDEIKKKYDLENKIVVLGIGGVVRNFKGVEYTVEALSNLSIKYKNLCLITISSTSDINQLNINKNLEVIELGKVTDEVKNGLFNLCDIFCMPSQIDSFGLVYLEACFFKKPIVAFDVPPVRELFSEGSLLSNVRDVESLTKNLEKLIQSRDLRDKLGVDGFVKLNEKYTNLVVKDFYLKLFS